MYGLTYYNVEKVWLSLVYIIEKSASVIGTGTLVHRVSEEPVPMIPFWIYFGI